MRFLRKLSGISYLNENNEKYMREYTKDKKKWCAEIKPQKSQFVENKKELTRINFIFS